MFSSRFPPSSTASLCLQMAFHFRLLSFFLSFCFPFLFNILPPSLSIARLLARSLARSLFSPYSSSLASHSYSSFYSFLLLAFLHLFVLSLVFTLSFFSFSSPSRTPCSILPLFTFPHYFMSSTPFPIFSSPYFLVHILYISSPLSSFFLTSSQSFPFNFAFVVVLFPNPSSCSSTPAILSSCHASFFLSFPHLHNPPLVRAIFLHLFPSRPTYISSHFSTPSSCFFFY